MIRSRALFGLAAVALVPRGAFAADAAATIRVGVGTNDTGSVLYYADRLGAFKKRNLEVQIQPMRNGAAQAAAVAGGQVDVAESNVVSIALAHERGIPFVYFAPSAQYNTDAPTTELVVAKTSAAKTAKDLDGKVVGVVALRDLTHLGALAWLERNGGDTAGMKFIEVPAAEMGAALKRGTIDAATVPEPALGLALQSGDARVFAKDFDAIAPRFLLNGWFSNRDWLAKNADAAKRFAEAIREAAAWGNTHHKESAEIFKQISSIKPEIIETMTRASFAERLTPALVQPVIDAAAKYKVIAKGFAAADIIAVPS